MKRPVLTAAAMMAGAAGAMLAWDTPWPTPLGESEETSMPRPLYDDKESQEQASHITQSAAWQSCAHRLDAGDPQLSQEVSQAEARLGLNAEEARRSVLVVCANDTLIVREDIYRRGD